ncbi:MAG: ComEC/Rec2 family competence protein, partial [Microcoleaceae cyanobacterium]
RAIQVNEIAGNNQPIEVSQEVSGKVYVTVSPLQATGLYPNLLIAVTGNLYQPRPAANPGGFDFTAYLARQATFAGLKARYLTFQAEPAPQWGWWQLRQRIVQAQVERLGVPRGALLSAMVLGGRAVDLPYDVRDQFVQVGLAHILAASGFHVSLLLGVVLALGKRCTPWIKFWLGLLTLVGYVGMTGCSPSVLRAALMGGAALVALVADRKVKSLGALLMAAVVLLVINPLWIWDLGFQLSFLATLGLLVTVAPMVKRLDWMPPVIASGLAVPLAATIWTLPLQLYAFHIFSPYSIVVNVLAVPFITILTLGGVLSGGLILVWPHLGGMVAALLDYPLQGLMEIVDFFNGLPGNSIATGEIALLQLLALYGINGWIWWHGARRQALNLSSTSSSSSATRKGLNPSLVGLVMAIAIVGLPAWYTKTTQFQATVLATSGEPILVIQDRGNVTLVNSGSQDTARYTVLPFLQAQGVNQIEWSVATHSRLGLSIGWPTILEQLPVITFYDNPSSKQTYYVSSQVIRDALEARQVAYRPLAVRESVFLDSTQVQLLNAEAPVVQFIIGNQQWTLLGDVVPEDQILLAQKTRLPATQVLWWSGMPLNPTLLKVLRPRVAIASSDSIDPETAELLQRQQTQVFWTGRDGALQWTPKGGFKTTLSSDETDGLFL